MIAVLVRASFGWSLNNMASSGAGNNVTLIGINAGEPIAEDNDLFGTTVQVSARITDKAQADEILVSEIVRGICVGKAYKFNNRGSCALKGLEEDIVLYELIWRAQSATAE